MNFTDPIILTAYLLCIAYCIYKIINAFNDELTIRLDEENLKDQLAKQGLEDVLGISFKFEKQYEFDKIKTLRVNIANKSSDYAIYVDWDNSAFSDLDGGQSRRVTRLAPGTTLDLFQQQASSTIAPKTTLSQEITAEDILKRKGDAQEIEVGKPIVDLKPAKPSDARKRQLERFMKRLVELEFFLVLAFRIMDSDRAWGSDRILIRCRFILKKLPWEAGLPWTPKD